LDDKLKIKYPKYKIKQEIKKISSIDTTAEPIDTLYKSIDILLKGMWTPFYGGPFYEVWRARNGEYNHISELWYPPKEYVTKLGRMNIRGESMFYSCFGHNAKLGSLTEIRVKKGDRVTQLCCSLNQENKILKVLGLGHLDQWMKNKAPEHMQFHFHEYEKQLKKDCGNKLQYSKNQLLKDWVNSQFIKKVSEGEEHKYCYSIAIAKGYFNSFGCDGILYPSVASNKKAVNLVLKPDIVDQYFKPKYVRIVEVIDIRPEGIELKLKNESKTIAEDGSIEWAW